MKRLQIDMKDEDHKLLKVACAEKGITMREFVYDAICAHIGSLRSDGDGLEDQSIDVDPYS